MLVVLCPWQAGIGGQNLRSQGYIGWWQRYWRETYTHECEDGSGKQGFDPSPGGARNGGHVVAVQWPSLLHKLGCSEGHGSQACLQRIWRMPEGC